MKFHPHPATDVARCVPEDEEVPGPVVTAALLATAGVCSIVVGSVALLLRGANEMRPGDLDIVPEPSDRNLRSLVHALTSLGTPARAMPTPAWLMANDVVRVPTFFGPMDLMMERARQQFESLCRSASVVNVLDCPVLVASLEDASELRRRFKGCDV